MITNVMIPERNVMVPKQSRSSKKKTVWHPELIKAAIRMRGKTLSDLSLENGLDESAVRAALIRSQPQAEKVIAAYLGVPLQELWPERYDSEGLRIRHVRDENYHDRMRNHRLSARVA
jgi:Ner family transcriptional regulator